MDTKTEAINRVRQLLAGMRFCMLTTVDGDGTLKSRPMATQDIDDEGRLWFFTSKETHKVEDLQKNPEVSVTFTEGRAERFISMSGQAEVIDDATKEHELWTPALRAWFPDGVDAPDLVLLCVHVQSVEYWDSPSSAMVQVLGFVRAAVTGRAVWGGAHEQFAVPHEH